MLIIFRELYHGDRWLNDERFFTPMVVCSCGDVYVGDFVKCKVGQNRVLAKVIRFYSKVIIRVAQTSVVEPEFLEASQDVENACGPSRSLV